MDYNKKEQLLDKINGLRLTSTNASDTLYNRGVVDAFIRTNGFFDEELIPEVPQYVIDWYEENKDNLDYNLWNFIMDWDEQEPSEFINWFNRNNKAFKTIVNMKQFGYKLKEEKKYLVKIKGNIQENILVYGYGVKRYFFSSYMHGNRKIYHTKDELTKGGFEWVFSCEGVEVKEVE